MIYIVELWEGLNIRRKIIIFVIVIIIKLIKQVNVMGLRMEYRSMLNKTEV